MKEIEAKPALRISHIVYGRINEGRRVTYLVDPRGRGGERAIAEQVVLRRWRRRKTEDYVFSGSRLSSTVWRALQVAFGPGVEGWVGADASALAARLEARRQQLRAANLRAPAPEALHALLAVCGRRGIRVLVERHTNALPGRSGVPDLFLFAGRPDRPVEIARFVEVKKPEEPVSRDQRAEIAFMHSLGLHARVLRLIER